MPGGVLFLGTSETVGEVARLFQASTASGSSTCAGPTSRAPHGAAGSFMPPLFAAGQRRHGAQPAESEADSGSLRHITEQALLAHYAQAGVLVNERGEILHIIGRTGKFLEPADGDAAINILPMAREGLRRELTVALHKAVAQRAGGQLPGPARQGQRQPITANLSVRPVEVGTGAAAQLVFLVVLEEAPADRGARGRRQRSPIRSSPAGASPTLEQELRSKDEYLQTTLEEMETTNEELKSTNEEMQSVNEELQSTNEELETSKEELQSVNEELSTVNAELQDKVADLSRANNDMNNLLAGTGVGTLFVDHEIRIARFTPAATQVINLINERHRPAARARRVQPGRLRPPGAPTSARCSRPWCRRKPKSDSKSGTWYLMRIRPYRTMENLIEGAVVTLVDISERKRTEESLRHSEQRLNLFINQAYAGVAEIEPRRASTHSSTTACASCSATRATSCCSAASASSPRPKTSPPRRRCTTRWRRAARASTSTSATCGATASACGCTSASAPSAIAATGRAASWRCRSSCPIATAHPNDGTGVAVLDNSNSSGAH